MRTSISYKNQSNCEVWVLKYANLTENQSDILYLECNFISIVSQKEQDLESKSKDPTA